MSNLGLSVILDLTGSALSHFAASRKHSAHRPPKHGVTGVNWPHFLNWGQWIPKKLTSLMNTVWLPTFNVYKACFCRVWVTIMHHQRH